MISSLGAGVAKPLGQRLRREAAEDDHVRRPDAGAREHRDRKLRDHAHVDADAVAFRDAELPQRVGKARDLVQHLRVREVGALAVRLADPVVGDAVASPGLDVAVEAVPGDVQLAVGEPGAVGRVPLEPLGRLLEPVDELVRETAPERLGILVGSTVDGVVCDDRLSGELLRRREGSLLVEQGFDCGLCVLGFHGRRI